MMNLISQQKHLTECIRKKAFLKRKHKLANLRSINITKFQKFTSIHVQYTRTESDRLGYATVRFTGSPIARDLEKYTEV